MSLANSLFTSDADYADYSTSDYGHVRSLIDVRLEEEDISDNVICSVAFLGSAEQETARLLKKFGISFSDLDAEEKQDVRLSVIIRTAAFLVPNVPQILQQTVGAIRHSWEDSNWERIQGNLLNRANRTLDDILEDETEAISITAFVTAKANRAGTWK